MIHVLMHKAFEGWLAALDHRAYQMELAVECLGRLMNTRRHRAFQGWLSHVNTLAYQKSMVEK